MRKKLFAVIMSVMMMVTFMPAMAFATPNATASKIEWSNDYSTATGTYFVEGQTKTVSFEVEKHFVDASANAVFSGKVVKKASADAQGQNAANAGMVVATVLKPTVKYNGEELNIAWGDLDNSVVTYYDLKDAEFVTTTGKSCVEEMEASEYVDLIDQSREFTSPKFNSGKTIQDIFKEKKIQVVEPADIAKEDEHTKQAKVKVSADALLDKTNGCVSTEEVLPKYELYDENTSLDLKVTFIHPLKKVVNADLAKQDYKLNLYINNINTVKVNTEGRENGMYVKSTAVSGNAKQTVKTIYCGGNQNFQVLSKGVTVTYSTDDQRTWTETAPEITDVDKYNFDMKVTRTDCKDAIYNMEVEVEEAQVSLVAKAKNMGFPVGYTLKVSDVVNVMVQKYHPDSVASGDSLGFKEITDKTVLAGLEKYVSLASHQSQGTLSGLGVNFDTKAFKADALKDEMLAKVSKNYKMPANIKVDVNFGVGYNDITAPNQTKTYHVKNAKALKKNQKKFQLKATADFGTPTFIKLSGNSKIKVYNNGKVLVKKGLKKGKYVVKVKVKAPGAKATKKLTVKVVK